MANTDHNQPYIKTERFLIESYDLELHEDIDLDGDGATLPIVQGMLIHFIVVLVIVLNHLVSDGNGSSDMLETTLVSSSEMADVQEQLKQRRSQIAENKTIEPPPQGNTQDTSQQSTEFTPETIVPITNEPSIGDFAKELLSSIPQKIENFTETPPLEEEFLETPIEDIEVEEQPPEQKQEQEKVAIIEKAAKNEQELKQKLLTFDETRKPPKESELDKTEKKQTQAEKKKQQEKSEEDKKKEKEELQKMFEKVSGRVNKEVDEKLHKSQKTPTKNTDKEIKQKYGVISSSSTGKVMSLGGDAPEEESSSSATKQLPNQLKNSASAGKGKPNAIRDKILSHFNPPTASGNDKTVAKITVDNQGNVLSVTATGDNPELNKAAEQAVRDASPLPHTAGDNEHRLILKGEGNK